MWKAIKPYGSKALLVEFEQVISEEIHQEVMALQQWITQRKIQGITFLLPAYCSLTVGFEPQTIDFQSIQNILCSFSSSKDDFEWATMPKKLFRIPICYASPYSPDLENVCKATQLSAQEVIALHSQTTYHVFMLGFLLGFPYLGQLPSPLQLPRKTQPTLSVAPGAVGIAEAQTGIYPIASPAGWHIIGQTPIQVFNPTQTMPFLLRAGDKVQFYAIEAKEFQSISEASAEGKFKLEPQEILNK